MKNSERDYVNGTRMKASDKVIAMLVSLVMASTIVIGIAAEKKANAPVRNVSARVYFSPNGGCTEAIVREIRGAQKEILIQAFSFTSDTIAGELIAAHKRKVIIKVVLDRSQKRSVGGDAMKLVDAGIPVSFDTKFAIAHSKVMVIDDVRVITGSFNFTASAETRNLENMLILQSKELARQYKANWQTASTYAQPHNNERDRSE